MDARGIWPLDNERRRKMLMSWRKDALVNLVMDLQGVIDSLSDEATHRGLKPDENAQYLRGLRGAYFQTGAEYKGRNQGWS